MEKISKHPKTRKKLGFSSLALKKQGRNMEKVEEEMSNFGQNIDPRIEMRGQSIGGRWYYRRTQTHININNIRQTSSIVMATRLSPRPLPISVYIKKNGTVTPGLARPRTDTAGL